MSARERFEAINRDFNDLPRRLLYGLALFAALVLFFFLFRYVAPFAIGFAVALMIEPVVRWITPAFRRIHPEGFDIRRFFPDVSDHSHLRDQSI